MQTLIFNFNMFVQKTKSSLTLRTLKKNDTVLNYGLSQKQIIMKTWKELGTGYYIMNTMWLLLYIETSRQVSPDAIHTFLSDILNIETVWLYLYETII